MRLTLRVALATDSADPSGVGRHMIDLAAHLPPGIEPSLGFEDAAAARPFVARARGTGLAAEAVADWGAWLDDRRPDLLHVHAGIGWEGQGLVMLARERRLPVIRTEHLPWLITDPAQARDYARMVAGVASVIAVSEASGATWRAALAALDGPRHGLAVIPNGVARPDVPARAAESATILCVGRLTTQKAHDVLLDAFATLRESHPEAHLLIAGDGPEAEALRARAGVGVSFLGHHDDVPALMARATLLVLSSRFEGLPLAVLEAMSLGLPVVATRIGGVEEALGADHPWLVPPGDAPALARALARCLDHPDRDAVGAAGQARWAGRFTASRMAAETARLYRALARPPRPSRTDARPTPKDPMDHLRIGFIGAGGIAHRHFGTLLSMPDVTIAALSDPDEGARARAAERTGAQAFASHEEMLAAGGLDAVYICVPPFAHGAPERACLAAGLPFFVEKPLSLDLALAEEIGAEVEAAGLVTAVGYHWRYLDVVDRARGLLADNPAHLMSGYWIDQTPPPRWWWREDASGGQIVEQATHIIDLARFLAGDVAEVFGLSAHRDRADFEGLDVPTASTATLRFASGAIANLSATCLLRWGHRVGLHVFSDAMAIEITDHDIMVDTGHGRPVTGAEGDPVWREDRDFVVAAMGGPVTIRAPYRDALMTHRVALAAAQSARTGQVVNMEALRLNPQPPFRHAPQAGAGRA